MKRTLLTALICFLLIGCCNKLNFPPPIVGNAYIPSETYEGTFTHHSPDPQAHRTIFPVTIDQSFALEDRKKILAAISELNYVMNDYMVLTVVSDSKYMSDRYGIVIEQEELPDQILGLSPDGIPGHRIQLDIKKIHLFKDDLTPIVIHEMGHAFFGLSHIEIEQSIMYPSVDNQPNCADKVFIQQIASVDHGMKVQYLNYCILEPIE